MTRQSAIRELAKGSHGSVLKKSDARLLRTKQFVTALIFSLTFVPLSISGAKAQQAVPFAGIQLSDSKDPVSIDAAMLEMRDKEGVAVFSGGVSVKQGDILLRSGRMQVFYAKAKGGDDAAKSDANKGIGGLSGSGLGAGGIEKLVVDGKVYLKSGTQVATGDEGVYDSKTQTMVLTGKKVVLSDGDNIATGCKLTANTQTGKAFLESCKGQSGRVSIILSPKSQ